MDKHKDYQIGVENDGCECDGCTDGVDNDNKLPPIGKTVMLKHSSKYYTAGEHAGKEVVILCHTFMPNGTPVAAYATLPKFPQAGGLAAALAFERIKSPREKLLEEFRDIHTTGGNLDQIFDKLLAAGLLRVES